MKNPSKKRALLSVSNKIGINDFASALIDLGFEIISTGGTSQSLSKANIEHVSVESITHFPEIFSGRVKTLHPMIQGGILGRRDKDEAERESHQIEWIDLVVVNLYPFAEEVKDLNMPWSQVVEWIDIGGPTLIRAAAKNFNWVAAITDPNDYLSIISELNREKQLTTETKLRLAEKAFDLVTQYDEAISAYFKKRRSGKDVEVVQLTLEKYEELRYGENPHQSASAFKMVEDKGLLSATKLQGKALSYNNLLDGDAAMNCLQEFSSPACVIVKHGNPCGVALGTNIVNAFKKAYEADSQSAFGGIVALNRPCDLSLATLILPIFFEVIIAPAFSAEALALLSKKINLRLLVLPSYDTKGYEFRFIEGAVLKQSKDLKPLVEADINFVTEHKIDSLDFESISFAWKVVKHLKSNAILIANDHLTLGIGAGQVSRIDAVNIALQKAAHHAKGAILASDAFFPFRDSIDLIAKSGIKLIIQPGGSLRDQEVIQACNEHQIAMVFTGIRCFKH